MSDQQQISQLSALFDGELPPEQAELVIRRALRDPATRVRWDRYALIGACLRQEPLASTRGVSVAERVAARLSGEAELGEVAIGGHQPAAAPRLRQGLFGRSMLGGAIAAGVALVCIAVVREVAPVASGGAPLLAEVAVAEEPAPSYTTPVNTSPATQRVDRSLASYMMAHSEVTHAAYRLSPLSAVMYGGYDPTIGAVEMTEAEIGDRR